MKHTRLLCIVLCLTLNFGCQPVSDMDVVALHANTPALATDYPAATAAPMNMNSTIATDRPNMRLMVAS